MLSFKEKELIKDYVKRYNTFQLSDLCDYLIENGSNTEVYSTGKYKIYPYVAIFIESYLPSSQLEILNTENNVQYKIIGKVPEDKEDNSEIKEPEKQSKMGQLSLF